MCVYLLCTAQADVGERRCGCHKLYSIVRNINLEYSSVIVCVSTCCLLCTAQADVGEGRCGCVGRRAVH